jgi:membrane glycosyltransferase
LTDALDQLPSLSSARSMTDPRADRRVLGRRLVFLALVLVSVGALVALAGLALSSGGLGGVDLLLLLLFGLTTPWLAVGFWNATVGFLIMRFARNLSVVAVPQAGDPQPQRHDG